MSVHVSRRLSWRYHQKPSISAGFDAFRSALSTIDGGSVSHGWHMDHAVSSASVSIGQLSDREDYAPGVAGATARYRPR